MSIFADTLRAALARWNIRASPRRLRQLAAHFERMIEWNRRMNLTRITDPQEAAVKHYADSLALLLWAGHLDRAPRTVLDVGAGAGFPAVPLAVMRPDWSVTALDATRKKIEFLRHAARQIGLTNLHCVHAHSAHWKPPHPFELVVCRALARLDKAVEQTAPHVAPAGRLVIYKTAAIAASERRAGLRMAARFNLQPAEPIPYDLPSGANVLKRVLFPFHRPPDTPKHHRLS